MTNRTHAGIILVLAVGLAGCGGASATSPTAQASTQFPGIRLSLFLRLSRWREPALPRLPQPRPEAAA